MQTTLNSGFFYLSIFKFRLSVFFSDNTHVLQLLNFVPTNLNNCIMNSIQFIGTTPTALISEIKNAIIPQLKLELSKEFQPKEPTTYLTRAEVCELLQIDLSTLHRWRKSKIITAYGIENRVYFKRNEIEELITNNQLI